MYKVRVNGLIVDEFPMFTDAWLYVTLELIGGATITGPDGEWTITDPNFN